MAELAGVPVSNLGITLSANMNLTSLLVNRVSPLAVCMYNLIRHCGLLYSDAGGARTIRVPCFDRKELRGKLALAITANFKNYNTREEAAVDEISGVAFIFNQKFFKVPMHSVHVVYSVQSISTCDSFLYLLTEYCSIPQELNAETGIDLENIVYYKDDTHYFVMTAKKESLLKKGVLKAVRTLSSFISSLVMFINIRDTTS